jgi:hypothetical protein
LHFGARLLIEKNEGANHNEAAENEQHDFENLSNDFANAPFLLRSGGRAF